jgi:flavin-binding protein dodecin
LVLVCVGKSQLALDEAAAEAVLRAREDGCRGGRG